MNRRTLITTIGGIALGTTAGCLSNADETTSPGDNQSETDAQNGDDDGGGGPDIPVNMTTSDGFDDIASHGSPDVQVETKESTDGETEEEYPVVEYTVEPTEDECADVTANVKVYDDEGVVIDEFDSREQYEANETYRATHTVRHSPEDVSEIGIGLSVNSLSGMCYV